MSQLVPRFAALAAAIAAATAAHDAFADAPRAAVFTKGPYLQALGPNGVTIKFELGSPQPAKVEIFPSGVGGAAIASREISEARGFHAIRVDGLAPATAYEYRVAIGGAASDPGKFTTAPVDGRPFRFLLYGDSRTDPEAHAAVVRAMEAVPADFLVNTGDMVADGGDAKDWRDLFAIEGKLLRERCVFVSVGNHELYRGNKDGEVAFLRYFAGEEEGRPLERLYGTFRWGNTRFFMLNAMDTWTGAERAWLKVELERARREPGLVHRIAVMHHGPFSSGPHGGNKALADGEVNALMREQKIDLVLAGHDHAYERGAGDGLKYVVSGGAGAPLYPRKYNAPQTRTYLSVHHFVELSVDGERVSMVARRASGGVIETCGFTGDGPWECDAVAENRVVPPAPSAAADPAPSAGPARVTSACACAAPGSARGQAGAIAAAAIAAAIAIARRRR
jgi:hypothetical protein